MNSQRIRGVLRSGKRVDTPVLTLYAAPALDRGEAACVVGKKVHKSAVTRHRYQRLLRTAIREILPAVEGYDIVVVAKPTLLSFQKMSELKNHLEPLLKKFKTSHANHAA